MAFFDKLNQVAKNIGDKTSDAIETGKLNSKVNSEKNLAGEELKKIGEFYYNQFDQDRSQLAPLYVSKIGPVIKSLLLTAFR